MFLPEISTHTASLKVVLAMGFLNSFDTAILTICLRIQFISIFVMFWAEAGWP